MLHHAAALTASPEDIHAWHLRNGWAGFGYHFYVRKDGSIHRGRPLWAAGAHTLNFNSRTIGVCCEGNYDVETAMPDAQLQSLRAVLRYLKGVYPNAAVKRHSDYNATACPGRHFPFAAATEETDCHAAPLLEMTHSDQTEANDLQRYNTVAELPEAYRGAVQALIDLGFLKGRDSGALDLTEDMARVLVVCARMEGVA